jgi:hypothetical protein
MKNIGFLNWSRGLVFRRAPVEMMGDLRWAKTTTISTLLHFSNWSRANWRSANCSSAPVAPPPLGGSNLSGALGQIRRKPTAENTQQMNAGPAEGDGAVA